MNRKRRVIAGIVTFNPDLERLILNIKAILDQVEKIIIVDNASENFDNIRIYLEKNYDLENEVKIIRNSENVGIGRALNQIFEEAEKLSFDWVVTLDQDSVVPKFMVDNYFEYDNLNNLGQISTNIFEKNTQKLIYKDTEKYSEVSRCITSGSMTSMIAWKSAGGYDDDLFIDYVDYDFSMKVKNAGYKIIRLNKIYIEHELGNSEKRRFFFISIRVPNYSPFRKYYIARNIIIYIKRYFSFKIFIIESLRLLKLIIYTLFENDKKNKYISIFRGIQKGIKYSERS